jgi:GDPmannose 4,6-dehydratase
VLATGENHSVREFIELAFAQVRRTIEWRGQGEDEVGVDANDGRVLVRVDRRYFRPTEVDTLLGDASKAERELGWQPETSFQELVAEMVRCDLEVVAAEKGRRQRVAY